MNNDIKKTLINTFGRISYLTVIFFLFTFILFIQNDVNDPLKESWIAGISFLSVLSTLGAAYIASSLFNDWREQPKLEIKIKLNKNKAHLVDIIVELRTGNYNPLISATNFEELNIKLNDFNKTTNELTYLIDEYVITIGNHQHDKQSSIYENIKTITQELPKYPSYISQYFHFLEYIKESTINPPNLDDSRKVLFMESEEFLHPNLIRAEGFRDENGDLLIVTRNIAEELADLFDRLSKNIKALI